MHSPFCVGVRHAYMSCCCAPILEASPREAFHVREAVGLMHPHSCYWVLVYRARAREVFCPSFCCCMQLPKSWEPMICLFTTRHLAFIHCGCMQPCSSLGKQGHGRKFIEKKQKTQWLLYLQILRHQEVQAEAVPVGSPSPATVRELSQGSGLGKRMPVP